MNKVEEYGKDSYRENVTVFSNKNKFRSEDIPAIIEVLSKGNKTVQILEYELVKDMDEIRVYDVIYTFVDDSNYKTNVK